VPYVEIPVTARRPAPWWCASPRRQRLQRRFRDVPAEIFVNPPARLEAYFAEERASGRPSTAHMLATGFVVFDADPIVDRLLARAADQLADPPRPDAAALRARAYQAASLCEDALDIFEADPEAAQLLLVQAVQLALQQRFWAAGRWQPRAKELLRALAELDPPLAAAARAFVRAADGPERRRLGERIVAQAVGQTGFFEWESELA
jgi:hypothetical protein